MVDCCDDWSNGSGKGFQLHRASAVNTPKKLINSQITIFFSECLGPAAWTGYIWCNRYTLPKFEGKTVDSRSCASCCVFDSERNNKQNWVRWRNQVSSDVPMRAPPTLLNCMLIDQVQTNYPTLIITDVDMKRLAVNRTNPTWGRLRCISAAVTQLMWDSAESSANVRMTQMMFNQARAALGQSVNTGSISNLQSNRYVYFSWIHSLRFPMCTYDFWPLSLNGISTLFWVK